MRASAIVFLFFALLLPALVEGGEDFRKRVVADNIGHAQSDLEAELEFGREVSARILGRHRAMENQALLKYVNLLGKSLASQAGRPELEFRFGILQTDYVNAYAAPGGYIFVTKAAIEKAEDEAELAAILAHEIAHVTERHIVKELNIKGSDSSAVSGVARLLGGAGDPARIAFLHSVDKAMAILFDNGYKMEDELEADRQGTMLLAVSGYDPGALKRYLEKILKDRRRDVSKTHPASRERINAVAEVIEKEGLAGGGYVRGKERFDAHKKK